MSPRAKNGTIRCTVAALLATAAIALAACDWRDDAGDTGYPESELTLAEATAPLKGAPPALTSLRQEANQVVDGGWAAFKARLDELKGTPVVVNLWASWCGPCLVEFPYFQLQAIRRAGKVAFIGVLTEDGRETGETFLEHLPVPYPSYLDPDREVGRELDATLGLPNTVFIDSAGEVAYTKYGEYKDEEALAADIRRYAQ